MMKKQLIIIRNWADERLRHICGKPSPAKRLVTVLVLAVILGGTNIYFVVSSIYNIGKHDAELMQIEHIKQLELHHSNDSINFKNNQYGK
jgi:hypothetical protein